MCRLWKFAAQKLKLMSSWMWGQASWKPCPRDDLHQTSWKPCQQADPHQANWKPCPGDDLWVRKWWRDGPNFHFIICVGMELCISVCWNIATSKFWIRFQVLWVPIVQRSTPLKFRLCFLSVMTFHWDISGRHQIRFVFLWCAQLVLDTRTKAQEDL